jgi:hypothetical protein
MAIPVVRFPVGKGTLVFYGQGSNNNPYSVGDKVSVAYRRSDPEVAYIRTFSDEFFTPLLMLLFASPFLLFVSRAVYVTVRERARGRRVQP